MKKILILLLFSACFISITHAQNFQWALEAENINSFLGSSVSVAKLYEDKQKQKYIFGSFNGICNLNFQGGLDTIMNTNNPNSGGMFAKYDSVGNLLLKKSYVNNWGSQVINLSVDAFGNIIVVGKFAESVNVGITAPHIITNYSQFNNYFDMFICKYSSNGNLLWARQLGDTNSVIDAMDFTINQQQEIIITGLFNSSALDFDPGVSSFLMSTQNTFGSTFVLKLDPNGNFVWVKKMEGVSFTQGFNIESDDSSFLYIAGAFTDTMDANPGSGVYTLIGYSNGESPYIVKLNNAGQFVWAKSISTPNILDWLRITNFGIDKMQNVYYGGWFENTVDFNPSSSNDFKTSNGSVDVFLSKLDKNGNYQWTQTIGNQNFNSLNDIVVDSLGESHLLFTLTDTLDFDPGNSIYNLSTTASFANPAILKLDSNGHFMSVLSFGLTNTPNSNAGGESLTLDKDLNVTVFGQFNGTVDFNPSVGVFNLSGPSNGFYNLFLTKFSFCGTNYNFNYTTCDTAILFGNTYSQSANFVKQFSDINGCDSNINVNLKILKSYRDTTIANTCHDFTWRNTLYTQSGNYTQSYQNAAGCDSNYYLQLTVQSLGGSIVKQGDTLIAMPAGYVYQWYDCGTNQPINGASNQIFKPLVNGSYFVKIVYSNDCVDTVKCESMTLGVNNYLKSVLSVSPNPTKDYINIKLNMAIQEPFVMKITDILGRVIKTNSFEVLTNEIIDIRDLQEGIYYLHLNSGNLTASYSILKIE